MSIPAELAFASVRELGKRLRAGDVTAFGLTEFFLDRLEKHGPEFNALVTLMRDSAIAQARRADRERAQGQDRGPLHGIPYAAKDLFATPGVPVTWGAAPYRERIIDGEARVIRRLHDAGAILVAKLAMAELAGGLGYEQPHASFTGPGLNPWNRKRWSGGSSGGSAAAVAAGLVPFALGTETWGSIMTPAAYCGVTGLRPTYGRVSRTQAMALSPTMDKIGPICQTADDCGLVLDAIAGHDPDDPSSIAAPWRYDPDDEPADSDGKQRFRIALLAGSIARVQPDVRRCFETALETLGEIAGLEVATLPDLPYSTVASTIISCEMGALFEPAILNGDVWHLTAPEDRYGAHPPQTIAARDYINAMRIRRRIQHALDEMLTGFDAVATPTVPTVASPIDSAFREWRKGYTGSPIGGAANAAGLPGITVPAGFAADGLPVGLQFVSRAFDENRLLAVARAFQARTTHHQQHPEL